MKQAHAATQSRRIQKPLRANRHVSLRDRAYETIRHQIVSCELKPGEAVTVTDLANSLNIGRTPVIQAIDRLVVDGLVEVLPRKGVMVCPVSLNDFVEIIEMRLLNEAAAVRWASEKAGIAEIAQMEANLDATWRAARQGDIDEFIDLDREFHKIISLAARNNLMSDFLGNLHDKALRFWFISLRAPDQNTHICEQHAAIVKCISRHDPDSAEKAMRDHISAFHANATSQILRI
jgi:DNA-binding GntR family transcriptional regulator